MKPSPASKRWPFASLPSAWSIAKPPPNSSTCTFRQHEPVAGRQSAAVLAALLRIGWRIKRESGSHRTLERSGWPDVVFGFHENEEIGPRMLARLAKHTGLTPEDL